MSEADDTAGALFSAGKLDAAIEAANAAVRRAPTELGPRILLAELLLFAAISNAATWSWTLRRKPTLPPRSSSPSFVSCYAPRPHAVS